MVKQTQKPDYGEMNDIINQAARVYQGHIPDDRYHEPYMSLEEMIAEIADGVEFYKYVESGKISGIMGIQDKGDVWLIRHAYVIPGMQRTGVGKKLLFELIKGKNKTILVGTWAAAGWAIGFYEKYGFVMTGKQEKTDLLRTYWNIPERQVETSVVLKLSPGGLTEEM